MNEEMIQYRERLPRNVFNGSRLKRKSIVISQWLDRILAISCLVGILYIVFISPPRENENATIVYLGVLILSIACIGLVSESERVLSKELNGSTRILIKNDHILFPPRFSQKLFGEMNSIRRDQIDHIMIIRGSAVQKAAGKNWIHWEDTPIGIIIVLKSGKKFDSGYKPPNTVKDLTDVLTNQWGIRIDDAGSGMGKGLRYANNTLVGSYSYEEIMKMDLFEWQN